MRLDFYNLLKFAAIDLRESKSKFGAGYAASLEEFGENLKEAVEKYGKGDSEGWNELINLYSLKNDENN